MNFRKIAILVFGLICMFFFATHQLGANLRDISGTVTDATGAVVTNASVEISNPVSGYHRTATTDLGEFRFTNVPFNPYHLTVALPGFSIYSQDVDVRSSVPVNLKSV